MTDTPYKALSADHQQEIQLGRLRELEARHYRLVLELDDAMTFGDEASANQLVEAMRAVGAQVSRAQARLGLREDEPAEVEA